MQPTPHPHNSSEPLPPPFHTQPEGPDALPPGGNQPGARPPAFPLALGFGALLGLIVFGYRLSIRGSSGESLASAALTGLASLALWGFFFSFIIFTWRVALRPLPGAEPWSPRNLRRSWHEGFYPALAFLGLLILLVAGISAQAG